MGGIGYAKETATSDLFQTKGGAMSNERLKRDIINNLDSIANNIDNNFSSMTIEQVEKLKAAIEAVWGVVCRRKK